MVKPKKHKKKTSRHVRSRAERLSRMDKDILDIEGVADMLGVSIDTVYKLANQGTIPGFRAGKEWRFHRQNIHDAVKTGSDVHQLKTKLKHARAVPKR